MLTGKDNLSKNILSALEEGTRVKDIPNIFSVSIDQAKRLSRYHNILHHCKDHISSANYEKLQQLGLKSLILSPYVKLKNWEELEDILISIPEDVTRNELKKIILAVEEKQKRINAFKIEIDRKIEYLESKDDEMQQRKNHLQELQKEIQKRIKFLKKYEPEVQEFLLKHIGISRKEKKLILYLGFFAKKIRILYN